MPSALAPVDPPLLSPFRYRALVVEDERLVRSVVRRALARADFDVLEAEHGQAALELARATELDLVVSDVRMPIMGGFELVRHLRLEQPDLPVVMLSGDFELAPGQTAEDLGVFALIRKPFSVDELQRIALRAVGAETSVVRGTALIA
jgi:CheY-like chemotaxis protein